MRIKICSEDRPLVTRATTAYNTDRTYKAYSQDGLEKKFGLDINILHLNLVLYFHR